MKNTVIFDLDGTLLDTLQDLAESVFYTQRTLGYPLHQIADVRKHVGNGIRVLIKRSLPAGTPEEEVEKALAVFRQHYGAHCNDTTRPYEGIEPLLASLKEEGYKMAIVSNKADFAVKELNEIYFADKIKIAIGEKESEGIRKKPAPDTVFTALKQLGSSVEEAVYVGDSEVDIETAKNSGMDCILCEWGFRTREDLEERGARIFVSEPEEIMDLLRHL